jgi:hypothetical protein
MMLNKIHAANNIRALQGALATADVVKGGLT